MSIELLSSCGRAGLAPRPPLPDSALAEGAPSITGYTYHLDEQAGVKCVVWGATPYRIHPKQRPDFEFSLLLEGSVTLTDAAGNDVVVRAGDAFVLPPRFTYQWGQHEPVLKYALSYMPPDPVAEGLVFTPLWASILETPPAADRVRTLFEEPTGRFQVVLLNCHGSGPAQAIPAGKSLATVVKGRVTISEGTGDRLALTTGQSAFIAADQACMVRSDQSADLLVCIVHPHL